MSIPTRSSRLGVAWLIVCLATPALVYAFICEPPPPGNPDRTLTLCSPLGDSLGTRIVSAGLEISFNIPPRDLTTYVSDVISPDSLSWGTLNAGEVVPGVTVSGTYLNVLDQRIELSVLQIGDANAPSGVVGTDRITMAWSSRFIPFREPEFQSGNFILDDTYQGQSLQLVMRDRRGPIDTTQVAGIRVAFELGMTVGRGWTAVFDVEDFDGFQVWRWLSDPTDSTKAVAVGRYDKVKESARPPGDWPVANPRRSFTFLDRFVIDGNVYHYAVQAFDRGFNRQSGTISTTGPFHSPLPPAPAINEPGPTQIRVDFLRPPPDQFQPVHAVPNPFRQSDCDATDFATTCTVRFINLPPRGTLLVYTVAGDLVRTFTHPDDSTLGDVPGTLRWDTRNEAGKEIASGVYIYKIIDLASGQESFGRLAIIR